MELEQLINHYFSKEKLAESICKYQLYYQIGLGNVVLQSLQDLQETVEKIDELNLQVKSEHVIHVMSKIIRESSPEELHNSFSINLKKVL